MQLTPDYLPETMVKPGKKKTPKKRAGPESTVKLNAPVTYRCTACGTEYDNQEKNFAYSYSPFYAGNNCRITICHECLNSFMDQYTILLGSEDKAIARMCLHIDAYLDDGAIEASKSVNNSTTPIRKYLKTLGLTSYKGMTYDNYLRNIGADMDDTHQTMAKEVARTNVETVREQVSFWGAGFAPDEYSILDEHYKSLNEQRSSDDAMQEVYIRDLCEIKVLQARALNNGRMDEWMKYKKLYQETAKTASLNPLKRRGATIETDADTWGTFLANVEQYTPAEYYKDKKLFRDFDGVGEYIKNVLLRPLVNLITGSKSVDQEYSIEDNDSQSGGDE